MSFVDVLEQKEGFRGAKGARLEKVKNAETELELSFANEYRQYLLEYGIACADGHEFTGISKFESLDVVTATKRLRERNLHIESNMYVVEILGIDGIVLCQTHRGDVYEVLNNKKPKKIYDSLEMYLSQE